jgi:hypothetical protein
MILPAKSFGSNSNYFHEAGGTGLRLPRVFSLHLLSQRLHHDAS